MLDQINQAKGTRFSSSIPRTDVKESSSKTIIIPGERTRYLAEIADAVRQYHQATEDQAEAVRRRWHLLSALEELGAGNRMRTWT